MRRGAGVPKTTNSTHDFFQILGKILLRYWIFGILLLFVWVAAFPSRTVHLLHGPMFGIDGE